ncbi:hypothetical protein [Streptomyces chartreusis]|uniref:hypothetical protein n=1 Tax=Streptomyces chartreusis TaxID=1969 RepID=UPI0036C47843
MIVAEYRVTGLSPDVNWRARMRLVAAIGALALAGVSSLHPVFSGFHARYTYLGPVLNPATGGNATKLSALL